MNERTLGFIIGAVNIILAILCGVFFMGKDKTAPIITIEPVQYVYEEDLPEDILYQGITAFDVEDGDVTSKVVIEKVVTDRERGEAIITYGVSDSYGNVGKAVRILDMPVLTRIQFPGAGESGNTEVVGEITNTEEQSEPSDTVEEDVTEENADAEVVEDTEEMEEVPVENAVEENIEEVENTETEEEGTTTGGNVTVVGSNNRRN